jgi:quercetin dioxygenase-like cupin family protein
MPDDKPKPPINVDYFEDLTGDIQPAQEVACGQIGDHIKRLREEKGITIAELSRLTGFDEQKLHEIEAHRLCPQLGVVIKLSKALDSAFERVLSGEGHKMYAITRRSERKSVSRSTSQSGHRSAYTYMSLAPEVKGRHMEALLVELEELTDEERSVHAGEEFIYVLDGTVTLVIGDDRFELEPGDSAYYLSIAAHQLAAKKGRAKILAVIYSG